MLKVPLLLLLFLAPLPASAHHVGRTVDGSGVAIASLSHSEAAVVNEYRTQIVDTLLTEANRNQTVRSLLNYSAIQRYRCLGSMVPGSITDDESPFNECSHAHLAALKAALVAMADSGTSGTRARDVLDVLSRETSERDAVAALCQFSGEVFNTGTIVDPDWRGVFGHLPSLLTFAGGLLMSAAFALFTFNAGRA